MYRGKLSGKISQTGESFTGIAYTLLGSGAFPGKMLLVRIKENSKFDAYFRVG